MKAFNYKTVLGLAVGERSLTAAEIVLKERPQVTKIAELKYPPDVTPLDTDKFGALLNDFRKEQQFTAKVAVVGLAARWLVVKNKEVPPADASSAANLLRLQAEAEFSAELKDLIYDFAGNADATRATSVLLLATPKKYVTAAVECCEAAQLRPIAVTSSVLTLGEVTGRKTDSAAMVLVLSTQAAELTSHHGAGTSALRHLRAPEPRGAFVSELRRAISTMPAGEGKREIVLWDGAGVDAPELGRQIGLPVRVGDLPTLGVETASAGINGEGPRYASAVALALSGVSGGPAVDFLHSRLAPPAEKRIPHWVWYTSAAVVLLIVVSVIAFSRLRNLERELGTKQAKLAEEQPRIDAAEAFVSKVRFAAGWHGDNPRYLAAMREVTMAIPDDEQTFATSLILREVAKQSAPAGTSSKPVSDPGTLVGQLSGKTTEHSRVEQILDRMRHMPAFTEVKLGGADRVEPARSAVLNYVHVRAGQAAGRQTVETRWSDCDSV